MTARNRKTNRSRIATGLATQVGSAASVANYIPQSDQLDGLASPFIGVDSYDTEADHLTNSIEAGSFSYRILILQRIDRSAGITPLVSADSVDDLECQIRKYIQEHSFEAGYWTNIEMLSGSGILETAPENGIAYRSELIIVKTHFDCNT
jgi:hypothetical protein